MGPGSAAGHLHASPEPEQGEKRTGDDGPGTRPWHGHLRILS